MIRHWHCPSCDTRDRTDQSNAHTQFHHCGAMGGLAAPLIQVPAYDAEARGRQRLIMKEDYTHGADPVAAVYTERADGSNDCTVFAPTAEMKATA